MPNKSNRLRRKLILSVGPVARRTIRRKDVGKAQVRILNPSAPGLRTPTTTSRTRNPKNPRTSQHRPIHNPHLTMMSQKTNFATTPILQPNIRPSIHQVGSSNKNFPRISTTVDGLSLCCLAATDGKGYHYYL